MTGKLIGCLTKAEMETLLRDGKLEYRSEQPTIGGTALFSSPVPTLTRTFILPEEWSR